MATPNVKLQRARLEKHWSVAVASRRVGVSTNTFNRWERGLQIPQLATLDQLLEAFEMSAQDLGFEFVISPHRKTKFAACKVASGERNVPEIAVEASLALEMSMDAYPARLDYHIAHSRTPHALPAVPEQVEVEQLSRRQVIAALIGTPAAIFGARQGDNLSLLRVEEILTLCASHIPLCWQLYFEGGRAEVEQVLPEYIAQLSALARYPSPYQKRAACLLSQAYQLASLLATQRQDYGAAYAAAREGISHGELAGEPNLQVASLIREALVSFFLKRPRRCLQSYQRALPLVSQVSPLLQGRVYAGLAEASGRPGQEDEARRFLEMARETFPQQAEDDPSFSFTHFTLTSISTYEGIMYLNLRQPDQARQAFERIDRVISTDAVPNRLELIVHQAMVACALDELEQTGQLIKLALPMAHLLGSRLRADQLYEIYEQMLEKWDDEPCVRELEELFRA